MTQQLNTLAYQKAAYQLSLINQQIIKKDIYFETDFDNFYLNFIEIFIQQDKLKEMTLFDFYYFTFNALTIFEAQSVITEQFENANLSQSSRKFLKSKMLEYIENITDEDEKNEAEDFWYHLEKETENELQYLINN